VLVLEIFHANGVVHAGDNTDDATGNLIGESLPATCAAFARGTLLGLAQKFVDGSFWHGCPKHCRTPCANKKFGA